MPRKPAQDPAEKGDGRAVSPKQRPSAGSAGRPSCQTNRFPAGSKAPHASPTCRSAHTQPPSSWCLTRAGPRTERDRKDRDRKVNKAQGRSDPRLRKCSFQAGSRQEAKAYRGVGAGARRAKPSPAARVPQPRHVSPPPCPPRAELRVWGLWPGGRGFAPLTLGPVS